MKKTLFFTIVLLATLAAGAAPRIKAVYNMGVWRASATWDLNRRPASGDTVVIPSNTTLFIDDNQNLTSSNLYIQVFGTLHLKGGGAKLTINSISRISVHSGGRITSDHSPSEVIKIGGNAVYQGTDPDVLGPRMATNATSGFTQFTPLPVKFLSFSVSRTDRGNLVEWATSEEINTEIYELERSENGTSWNTIAYVAAGGNSHAVLSYAFTDKAPAAQTVHYRVKQVDRDGSFSYTGVRTLRRAPAAGASVSIASAPGQGRVLIHFPEQVRREVTVRIITVSGQILSQRKLAQPAGQVLLAAGVPANGTYIVSVTDGQDLNTARQVIL
ncbi:MAG TPA: G8 domain-containing protein [Chitinophagaceae bacterium]|jgi:hypothetical protein|nr:G8 domain-containing protein [Chitinophagaceae bacterium]